MVTASSACLAACQHPKNQNVTGQALVTLFVVGPDQTCRRRRVKIAGVFQIPVLLQSGAIGAPNICPACHWPPAVHQPVRVGCTQLSRSQPYIFRYRRRPIRTRRSSRHHFVPCIRALETTVAAGTGNVVGSLAAAPSPERQPPRCRSRGGARVCQKSGARTTGSPGFASCFSHVAVGAF
jgi:hypothetical protein